VVVRAQQQHIQQQRRHGQQQQQKQHNQQQQQQDHHHQQQQPTPSARFASAAAAFAASVSLLLSAPAVVLPPPAAAASSSSQQLSPLADLVAADYSFIDADDDGVITAADLRSFNEALSAGGELPALADGQLEFTLRLFDLNEDGRCSKEELLRSLVLDGAVSDDAVDASVVRAFDANKNGKVDAREWERGVGDLGPAGGPAARYIFGRVDRLTSSNGELDASDFGTALVLLRTTVLGY
jgi:Ca2+-binding EF-hand superfamily protein